jgi:hypothetical protein
MLFDSLDLGYVAGLECARRSMEREMADINAINRDLAGAVDAQYERLNATLVEAKDALLQILSPEGLLSEVERIAALKATQTFYDLTEVARREPRVYEEIYLPLVREYNAYGGALPVEITLSERPHLGRQAQEQREQLHEATLRSVSDKITLTFGAFLGKVIEQASLHYHNKIAATISSTIAPVVDALGNVRTNQADGHSRAPEAIDARHLAVLLEPHLRAERINRGQGQTIVSALETCREWAARVSSHAEVEAAAFENLNGTVSNIPEQATRELASPNTQTTPDPVREILSPRTQAILRVLEACVNSTTGEVERFDFIESAYGAVVASLDNASARVLRSELEQIEEGVDPIIDHLRACVDEYIDGVATKEISVAIDKLSLSEETKATLVRAIASSDVTHADLVAIVEEMPAESTKAEWIAKLLLRSIDGSGNEHAFSRRSVVALAAAHDAFTRLLQAKSFDDEDARAIAATLTGTLKDWSDADEREKLKDMVGASIKKFSELRGCLPNRDELAWELIPDELDDLNARLKSSNDRVRSQLEELGASEDIRELIIKAHIPEDGPSSVETDKRLDRLTELLRKPITCAESKVCKKIDSAQIPSSFWLSVAKMNDTEWRDYDAKLSFLWKKSDRMPPRIFEEIQPSDLVSIAAIEELLRRGDDVAESDSEVAHDLTLVQRVRMAFEVDCAESFITQDSELADYAVSIVCFLANRGYRALYDNLRALKFSGKTEILDESLRKLQELGLVHKRGHAYFELQVDEGSLLEKALNKHVRSEAFRQTYEERRQRAYSS